MLPIQAYELTLKNFKSFGNNLTVINLDTKTLSLIIGRNLDASVNGQIDSNGAGKTSLLLDAISFAIFDKTLSGTSKDSLINDINKKNMEVSFAYKQGNDYYRIIRYRKNKARGGNGISFYKGSSKEDVAYDNLTSDKDIAQAGQVDKQIIESIAMPYDMFSRIVLFSARHEPFLALPASSSTGKASQKGIIEELIGVSEELSDKANKLNKEMNNDKKELDTLQKVEDEIIKQQEQITRQLNNLKDSKDQWDKDHFIKIEQLKFKLSKLENIDFDLHRNLLKDKDNITEQLSSIQYKIKSIDDETKTLESQFNNIKSWNINHKNKLQDITKEYQSLDVINFDEQRSILTKYNYTLNKIQEINSNKSYIQNEFNQSVKKLGKLEADIEHLRDNKCPYCLQHYASSLDKLDNMELQYVEMKGAIEEKNKSIKSMDKTLIQILEENISYKQKLVYKTESAISKEESYQQRIKDAFESISNEQNPYANENIDGLQLKLSNRLDYKTELNDKYNSLKDQKDTINKECLYTSIVNLELDYKELSTIKVAILKENNEQNPYVKSLEDMNQVIFDKSNKYQIKELNNTIKHKTILHKFLTRPDSFIRKAILNERLEYLNDRLKYYLGILGLPHHVSFTEELDVKITQFGIEKTYDQLSAGQQARINIALSFTFRDMLQKRFGKLNLCILDECLDVGLSNAGVNQAVQMIKKVAHDNQLSMFVISHRDEIISSFDNILEVELSNGFSTVIQN